MPKKKYMRNAEGKTISNLIVGRIATCKSSIIPNIKTGNEQNKSVWIKLYSAMSEKNETTNKDANIPTPPNLEIDFLCKV